MPAKAKPKADSAKSNITRGTTEGRRGGRAVLATDVALTDLKGASEVSFYHQRRNAIRGSVTFDLDGTGAHKNKAVASWVDLTQDEDHLRAETEAGRDVIREANEVQQLLVAWSDILKPDFTGEGERHFKPFGRYLHRCVFNLIHKQLHGYVLQERIQRFINALLKSRPPVKVLDDRPSRHELVHSVERTATFWDQLASAQSNTCKTVKGHLANQHDNDASDDKATNPPPSNIRPRHQNLQAISPRKWPAEARSLVGVQRKPTHEVLTGPRFSMYLDELWEESEVRSAAGSRAGSRAQSRQGDYATPLPDRAQTRSGLDKVFEAGDFRGQTPVNEPRGATPSRRSSTRSSLAKDHTALPPMQNVFDQRTRSPMGDTRASVAQPPRSRSSMAQARGSGTGGRGPSPEKSGTPTPMRPHQDRGGSITPMRGDPRPPRAGTSMSARGAPTPTRGARSPSRGTVGHWSSIRSTVRSRGIDLIEKRDTSPETSGHLHHVAGRRGSDTCMAKRGTQFPGGIVDIESDEDEDEDVEDDENGAEDEDGDDLDDDDEDELMGPEPIPSSWAMEPVISTRAASRLQADALNGLGWEVSSPWMERTAQVRYFRKCKKLGILPQPVRVFIHGKDDLTEMANQGQCISLAFQSKLLNGGANLQALASAIPAFHDISLIDISRNSLDDSSVANFLETLNRVANSRTLCFASLQDVRLGYNRLGSKSLKALKSCCEGDVLALQGLKLDLSGVEFSSQQFDLLIRMCTRREGLVEVRFEEMALGRYHQGPCKRAIDLVLACRGLVTLELGSNHFREDGLGALSSALRLAACRISLLSLAGNACAVVRTKKVKVQAGREGDMPSEIMSPPHPMLSFCESLRDCHSLTKLNLSSCGLGAQACVCIEAALKAHSKLTELDLSQNPLGEDGLRAVLRHTCLRLLDTRWHCDVSLLRESMDISDVEYNYQTLSAEYRGSTALHLSHPYHRAVLKLLLHRAQRMGKGPDQVLQHVVYNGNTVRVSNLDLKRRNDGLWQVPSTGILEFDFLCMDQMQFSSATHLVQHWHKMRRIPVSLLKFVHVCDMWKQLRLDVVRLLFVSAISKDMQLRVGQVRFFVMQTAQDRPHLVPQVMLALSTSLAKQDRGAFGAMMRTGYMGGATEMSSSMKSAQRGLKQYSAILTAGQRRVLTRQLHAVATCNLENPNGHYELNLELPQDYLMAEKLILVSRWESEVARERCEVDTSQGGNYQGIRNLEIDGVHISKLDDFYLPGDGFIGEGVLTCDFCTQLRFAKGAEFLSEVALTAIMSLLSRSHADVSVVAQAETIRAMSHRIFLSAVQLRMMLLKFAHVSITEDSRLHAEEIRIDLFCALFPRCTQFGAPLVHRTRGILGDSRIFAPHSMKALTTRLGLPNTLDVDNLHEHPWNEFSLDFSVIDHRLVGKYLMAVGDEEPGINMVDTEWTEWKGTGNAVFFVPSIWLIELPRIGIFSCHYEAEREEWVYIKFRRELAAKEFGWLTLEDPHGA